VIDPIYTDTVAGKIDQWIPIRPGTDAALVEAIAYELIRNNWVDEAFLEKYCIGYNEKTLPKSAPPSLTTSPTSWVRPTVWQRRRNALPALRAFPLKPS
jgi:anaerobic selenocysteine-containing dehydrogenase